MKQAKKNLMAIAGCALAIALNGTNQAQAAGGGSAWAGIELRLETGAVAGVVRRLPPLRIIAREKGKWIVDFGQNGTGVARLEINGPRGTEVVIHHAEDLRKDGGLITGSLKRAACTGRVICPGGPGKKAGNDELPLGFTATSTVGSVG